MKTRMKTYRVIFSTTAPDQIAQVSKAEVQATKPSVAIKKAYLTKGMRVEGSQVSQTLLVDSIGTPYDVFMVKCPYTPYEASVKEI